MGISRPLIHADFKTDGVDLFVHEIERDVMVNVSQDGQLVLKEALDTRLQRIEWDRKRVAVRLFPLVRLNTPDQPRTIVVDPRRGFGHPVIAGTGIRTSVIVERYRAGESYTALAADYGITEDKVEDAVRCARPGPPEYAPGGRRCLERCWRARKLARYDDDLFSWFRRQVA